MSDRTEVSTDLLQSLFTRLEQMEEARNFYDRARNCTEDEKLAGVLNDALDWLKTASENLTQCCADIRVDVEMRGGLK